MTCDSISGRIDPSCNYYGTSDTARIRGDSGEETSRPREPGEEELTKEEKTEVEKLKKRDMEVRTHEMAHVAAGGQYVKGGASFEYQTGPDNKRYAVGGEVSIDTSPEPEPEATIRKMQVVRKAALAPASPSAQDRAIAANASRAEVKARMELREQQREEAQVDDGEDSEAGSKAVYTNKGVIAGDPSRAVSGSLDIIA